MANYSSSRSLEVISSKEVKAMAKLHPWSAIFSFHKSVSLDGVLSTTTGKAGWYLMGKESSFLFLGCCSWLVLLGVLVGIS